MALFYHCALLCAAGSASLAGLALAQSITTQKYDPLGHLARINYVDPARPSYRYDATGNSLEMSASANYSHVANDCSPLNCANIQPAVAGVLANDTDKDDDPIWVLPADATGSGTVEVFDNTNNFVIKRRLLGDLAARQHSAFDSPSPVARDVGLIDTQEDRSMRSNKVRTQLGFGADRFAIETFSDSFARGQEPLNATSIADGDARQNVVTLRHFIAPDCVVGGRGMAQLILGGPSA